MKLPADPPPFQREVREWQRTDLNTGARLSGRIEAHRFNIGSLKKYGQVVDSQNIMSKDGTQLMQRKQLEVFQARVGNGSMQVVKSSTVYSSTSRKNRSGFIEPGQINVLPNSIMQPILTNVRNTDLMLPAVTNEINILNNCLNNKNELNNDVNHEKVINIVDDLESMKPKSPTDIKPKIPIRRRKALLIENQNKKSEKLEKSEKTDLPASVYISKVKKDLENTLRQKSMLNEIEGPKNNRIDCYSVRTKYKTGESPEKGEYIFKKPNRTSLNGVNVLAESEKSYKPPNKRNENTNSTINVVIKSTSNSIRTPLITASKMNDQQPSNLSRIEMLIENGRRRTTRLRIPSTSSPSVNNKQNRTIITIGPTKSSVIPNGIPKCNDRSLPNGINDDYNKSIPNDIHNGYNRSIHNDNNNDTYRSNSIGISKYNSRSVQNGIGIDSHRFQSKIPIRSKVPSRNLEEKLLVSTQNDTNIIRKNITNDDIVEKRLLPLKTSNSINTDNQLIHSDINNLDEIYNKKDNESESQLRKVKFCKTEVHFTAESGRVSIVETDSKQPSTNLYRRHRDRSYRSVTMRTTETATVPAIENGAINSHLRNISVRRKTDTDTVDYSPISLKALDNLMPKMYESLEPSQTLINEVKSDENFKGILTNKLVKPKPYHFGENVVNILGVHLRNIPNELVPSSVNNGKMKKDDEEKKDQILVVVKRNIDPYIRSTSDILKISGYSTKIPINGHAICT